MIDSLTFSSITDVKRTATVALHTRGPVDVDMPSYTIRGYSLHWAVISVAANTKSLEGDMLLPTLAPASQWSGEIEFIAPTEEYMITLSIIRPTGYSVAERSYDAKGELIP